MPMNTDTIEGGAKKEKNFQGQSVERLALLSGLRLSSHSDSTMLETAHSFLVLCTFLDKIVDASQTAQKEDKSKAFRVKERFSQQQKSIR